MLLFLDAGYRGEKCQESFHICDGVGSPCMNGGECVPVPGGTYLQHTCECVVGKENFFILYATYIHRFMHELQNEGASLAQLVACWTLDR